MKTKYFQISTAIDYPSGRFHLGHAYEKICTDVVARWKRMHGFSVHFSTGTDCHGQKIQRAAEKEGKMPLQFVKELSEQFKELCKVLNISYDDFIMTIEPRHEKVVVDLLNKLKEKGDIYKGNYEGLYCVDCETYYTEKDLLEENLCPIHKKKCELVKESSYFFKLSKYQKKLIEAIKKEDLIFPEKKKNEILSRLKEPLKDLSISRKNVSWGIPLPFEKDLTAFVWVDALINYLTTINYPNKEFKNYWPAVHFIGSDIVWHHTVIWYSILLALGLKLPRVVVHGFINLEGEKLSKARGITIDPIDLANKYSTDTLRYFLIRNIVFGEDGEFSEDILAKRNNDELADKLGNLVSRVSTLAEKYGVQKIKNSLLKKLQIKEIEKHFESFEIDKALAEIFAFIDVCNEYIQNKKPWETHDKKVLYELLDGIKISAILLWPFLPETSEKIAKHFGFEIKYENIEKNSEFKKIKKAEILFKKIEYHPEEKLASKINKPLQTSKIEGITTMSDIINYEQFSKTDLRVGTIKKVEDVEGADKLLKLEVDLGKELGKRTILAGIKQHYEKKELVGKQIIIVVNLEPRKMKGLESKGMLLAAVSEDHSKVILLSPEKKAENGWKVS